MDAALAALLDELYAAGREHDAHQTDRLARLRNLEPETARLLALLIRATGARRVLELGTSNGYSTLWLADAVRDTGGIVTSVELDPERSAAAAANLARAGLADHAELRVQDAADALAQAADESLDLVFLDAERPHYAAYWPRLLRAVRPGGLLAIDNVLSHAHELEEFTKLIETLETTVVPVGAGLRLAVTPARRTRSSSRPDR
jgi:predicted O-methyltransferase YrrM